MSLQPVPNCSPVRLISRTTLPREMGLGPATDAKESFSLDADMRHGARRHVCLCAREVLLQEQRVYATAPECFHGGRWFLR